MSSNGCNNNRDRLGVCIPEGVAGGDASSMATS